MSSFQRIKEKAISIYNSFWVTKFVLKASLVWIIAGLLFHFINYFNGFYLYSIFLSNLVYFVLDPFIENFFIQNNILYFISFEQRIFSVIITEKCLGWFPIISFISLVVALPIKRNLILKLLLFGMPVLWLINFFRLVLIVWVGAIYDFYFLVFFVNYIIRYDLLFFVLVLYIFFVHIFIGKKELVNAFNKK